MHIETASSTGNRNAGYVLLFLALLTATICGVLMWNTFYGDPSIYLTVAHNMASGYLFSFNPGEFSSGSTSPLWALLLSLGFIAGNGVIIAKLISLTLTLLSLAILFKSLYSINGSYLTSGIGVVYSCYFLLIPALLLYESALIVILTALAMKYVIKILEGFKEKNDQIKLFAILAFIPLARPDSAVIVVVYYLALINYYWPKANWQRKLEFALISIGVAAPSCLYYGISYLKTGLFSASSTCRAFALSETASSLLGIKYSPALLKTLIVGPTTIAFLLAILGVHILRKKQKRARLLISIICLGLYCCLLTIVIPTNDATRYILPVMPMFIMLMTIGIKDMWSTLKTDNNKLVQIFIIVVLVGMPILSPVRRAWAEHNRRLDFDTIVEKDIVLTINEIAVPNSTVLAYEVQDRYYLRPDIKMLSLDGITDGKIEPYLKNVKIYEFLLKYRPRYWLANDSVKYRPYLANSVFRRAIEVFDKGASKEYKLGKITLTAIKKREIPDIAGFAGWKYLVKIDYQ